MLEVEPKEFEIIRPMMKARSISEEPIMECFEGVELTTKRKKGGGEWLNNNEHYEIRNIFKNREKWN